MRDNKQFCRRIQNKNILNEIFYLNPDPFSSKVFLQRHVLVYMEHSPEWIGAKTSLRLALHFNRKLIMSSAYILISQMRWLH